MKRYQECNWIIKLWRRRWYLLAPFKFFSLYLKGVTVWEDEFVEDILQPTGRSYRADKRLIWSIVLGDLQTKKMNFYWTREEAFGKLKDR